MKKMMLAIALTATGLVTLPCVSLAAEDNSGWFLNGGVGRSNVNKNLIDDSDTGYDVNLGYRWRWFGVEAGYTNLGKFSNTFNHVLLGPGPLTAGSLLLTQANAEVHGYTLGVNGHFNFNDHWYLSGRAGAFRSAVSQDLLTEEVSLQPGYTPNTVGPVLHMSGNSWNPYAGIGFGYDFTSNFDVGVGYDYFKAKDHGVNLSGVG